MIHRSYAQLVQWAIENEVAHPLCVVLKIVGRYVQIEAWTSNGFLKVEEREP
jgi:hypothetical protein